MGRLEGKVALISGAARGMGAAGARLFAREGARVVLGDVQHGNALRVAQEIGARAMAVPLDVRSEQAWGEAVDKTLERFGTLDVLVNNAGIFRRAMIADTTPEQYMEFVLVNQLGVFLGMRAALKAMRGRGGSIVNVSSINGLIGGYSICAYTATKFAVRGMTKSAAIEFAGHSIRVNSIHPGNIDTDMTREALNDRIIQYLNRRTPLGRQGRAEEVAELALWLASEASSFCTGAEFAIDGGLTAG